MEDTSRQFLHRIRTFFEKRDEELRPFSIPLNKRSLFLLIHLYVARLFSRWSIFSPNMLYENPDGYSPYWTLILSYLHNEKILHSVRYVPQLEGYPPLHKYKISSVAVTEKDTVMSFGGNENQELSLAKGIGELLERTLTAYSSAGNPTKTLKKPAPELLKNGQDIATPYLFHRFLPQQKKQFPHLGFKMEHASLWVPVRNITKKRNAFAPAQTIFWIDSKELGKTEGVIQNTTTSGCAGYMTKDGAVLRALLEAIQRDAFLVHWLTGIPPKKIALTTIDDDRIQATLAEFTRYGFEVHLLDATTEIGVPVVISILIDRLSKRPRVYLAAACHPSYSEACANALSEANMLFGYFDKGGETYLPEDFKPFLTPLDRMDRLQSAHGDDYISNTKWFWSGDEIAFGDMVQLHPKKNETASRVLDRIVKAMHALGEGSNVYVFTPDSTALRKLGYHVARVIVPKLMSLYLNEILAPLDSDRLFEFAQRKGKTYSPEALLKTTTPPHPFP